MNRAFLRGALAVLISATFLCCVRTPAAFAAAETVLPPFAFWDIQVDPQAGGLGGSGMSLDGWWLPTGTWREQFPSPGALHVQSRYIDTDRSKTITRGDEIEATGPGPGIWRVEAVTTELALEPMPGTEGLPELLVASDKYFWRCPDTIPRACLYEEPRCGPRYPVADDSLFVLSPVFNQMITVVTWYAGDFFFCNVKIGDSAWLAGPLIPADPLVGGGYRLKAFRPGVWLSWDPSTDARRTSWGRMKSTYHR